MGLLANFQSTVFSKSSSAQKGSLLTVLVSHVILSKWLIYCKEIWCACGAGFNWVMAMFSDKHFLTQ